MRTLLLLLCGLANYETIRDLAGGAFMAGLLNMGVFCGIGTAIALRRSRSIRG